jgi:hypothetical protein
MGSWFASTPAASAPAPSSSQSPTAPATDRTAAPAAAPAPAPSKASLMQARLAALRGGGPSAGATVQQGQQPPPLVESKAGDATAAAIEVSAASANVPALTASTPVSAPAATLLGVDEAEPSRSVSSSPARGEAASKPPSSAPSSALSSPTRGAGASLVNSLRVTGVHGGPRFDPQGEAVVLYHCAGLVDGLTSPGTFYITQGHICFLFGLALSTGSGAGAGAERGGRSNSSDRTLAAGSATAARASGGPGIAQNKRIFPLKRLHALRVTEAGMFSSGSLVMSFFGGATVVTFTPLVVDCARLHLVLSGIVEVIKDCNLL